MKLYLLSLLISVGIPLYIFGQTIKLEPHIFVSRAGDTIAAELGTFKVLENRINNSNDSIELSFVRFKSTNPNPSYPIVYFAGGPGGSGIGAAKGNRFALFMKLRSVADVIAFDQIGTGYSNGLPVCPYKANFELDIPISRDTYVKRTSDNIRQCLDFWNKEGIDLQAYNTSENAKDIDALRMVLGSEKISIWGISYGSHLAFEYIRLFQNNIHKAISLV